MKSHIMPRIEVEDAGSLILFIDTFTQMMDMSDPDSRDTAKNVLRVRQGIHVMIDPDCELFSRTPELPVVPVEKA